MTFELKIDENDYLTYQLFVASQSKSIQRKRKRGKIIVPILYLLIGIYAYYNNSTLTGVLFCVFAVLWFFLYPIWERNNYIRHYKNFIQENFKEAFGKIAILEINDKTIFIKDEFNESKVSTTEINEIFEIPTLILIRLKGGKTFILPKDKIAEIQEIKSDLKRLAELLKISYVSNDKWIWR